MKKLIITKLMMLDIWLCMNLPVPIRHLWRMLWIRKDEFHVSLSIDIDHMSFISRRYPFQGWRIMKYGDNIGDRRLAAHRRDLGEKVKVRKIKRNYSTEARANRHSMFSRQN